MFTLCVRNHAGSNVVYTLRINSLEVHMTIGQSCNFWSYTLRKTNCSVSSRQTQLSHVISLLLQQLYSNTYFRSKLHSFRSPANDSLHLLISLTLQCICVFGSHSFGRHYVDVIRKCLFYNFHPSSCCLCCAQKFFNSRYVCQCIQYTHRITTVLLLYDFHKTHMLNALKFHWTTLVTFQSLIRLDLVSYVCKQ